jgi:hypothetical protein
MSWVTSLILPDRGIAVVLACQTFFPALVSISVVLVPLVGSVVVCLTGQQGDARHCRCSTRLSSLCCQAYGGDTQSRRPSCFVFSFVFVDDNCSIIRPRLILHSYTVYVTFISTHYQKPIIIFQVVLFQITGYCYWMVSYRASHALRPFSDLLCIPIWVIIIPDSSTRVLCSGCSR